MRYLTSRTDGRGKRAVVCWPRRAGKDATAMHATCMLMLRRPAAYWHVFPTERQGRKAIWTEFASNGQRVMEAVFPAAIRSHPREWSLNAEMVVELKNGAVWRLLGSDHVDVVGAGPVGVVFTEYALAKPSVWQFVSPMLRGNDGWAAFLSTPRGRNHFHKIFSLAQEAKGWFCDKRTVHDLGLMYRSVKDPSTMIGAKEMIEEEIEGGMDPAIARQEYETDWEVANVGAVYGELICALEAKGRTDLVLAPSLQLAFSVWDLGGSGARGDATGFWIYTFGKDSSVQVLAYYENRGRPLSHYIDKMAQVAGELKVNVVRHWLPHDARAMHLTGTSVLEQLEQRWGLSTLGIYPETSVKDGMEAVRWLLQRDVYFGVRCAEGVTALKAYSYEWDGARKTYSNSPVHDWSSHAADAFRGLALTVRQATQMVERSKPSASAIRTVTGITLDDLIRASTQCRVDKR